MKTLTTIEEIKAEAKKDDRSTMIIQLNKEIVDWFYSIGGKNREIVMNNLSSWQDCIRNGEWSLDNCEMKINSSCTWLIEGHHRVMAVDIEKAYGLLARLIVVPDENQEIAFRNQDCRGTRRNLGAMATLAGVQNAAVWLAVDKAYRWQFMGERTASTVDSVMKFVETKKGIIDKIDTRRKFLNENCCAPALATACMIKVAEKYPQRIDDLNAIWNRVLTGEMLTAKMPEFHLRNRFRNKESCSQKELVWLTLKALTVAMDGGEMGLLKLFDSDVAKFSSRYGVTSNKSKIGTCASINSTKAQLAAKRMKGASK